MDRLQEVQRLESSTIDPGRIWQGIHQAGTGVSHLGYVPYAADD